MCVGERRKLQIPAAYAYGMRGADDAVPGFYAVSLIVYSSLS